MKRCRLYLNKKNKKNGVAKNSVIHASEAASGKLVGKLF